QRFYAETVEPLVAYDEQYETDLVGTLEAFLEADGNVAGTAQRLFTHRHTIYYRLERVRELSGHDVSSSDGRDKLSHGPKALPAMRGVVGRGDERSRRLPCRAHVGEVVPAHHLADLAARHPLQGAVVVQRPQPTRGADAVDQALRGVLHGLRVGGVGHHVRPL